MTQAGSPLGLAGSGHDWQSLSVLNWFLHDHLLICLDILFLGSRPLPQLSFLLSPLTWLTLATLQAKPAASRRCLMLTHPASLVSAPRPSLWKTVSPACLAPTASVPQGSRGSSHLLGPPLSVLPSFATPTSSPDLGLEGDTDPASRLSSQPFPLRVCPGLGGQVGLVHALMRAVGYGLSPWASTLSLFPGNLPVTMATSPAGPRPS